MKKSSGLAKAFKDSERETVASFREFIKKLNNFKLTATIATIISALSIVVGVASFVCYHFSGPVSPYKFREVGFTQTPEARYAGMAFFFACLATIILGIVVIYALFPAVLNKEKIVPKKSFILVGAINSLVQILILVLSIVLIITERPLSIKPFCVLLAIDYFTVISSALLLVPYFCCTFYMPEIKK